MSVIIWLLLLLLQMFSSSIISANNSSINHNDDINLPLSPRRQESTNNNNNKNPWEILKRHAAASLERAQNHHVPKRNINDVKVPLHPRSFGEYTVNLSFGTPPQTLPFVVDTGSSLTWFPCAFRKNKYNCTNCNVDPTVFITKKSSSSKIVPCQSTQCDWLYPAGHHCNKTQNPCVYTYGYGSGTTAGLLLNETLALGGSLVVVDNFTVGCSVASAGLPAAGIVGFGRGPESLPSQMGLKSFSHCMVSHDDFDDNATAPTGDLVLTTATSSGKGGVAKFNYTPFLTNPRISEYYYVELQSISVGGVHVKVPDKYVVPNATGYGGTIVDSGTTLTLMKKPLFDLFLNEFKRQVDSKYKRVQRAENQTTLAPCYKVPAIVGKNKTKKLPQLTFIFKAGVQMVLPLSNYFSYADNQRSVLCMTILSFVDRVGLPPAIILGNYLQQDYYIKYDLENNQLGIRRQKCKK